MNDQLPPPAADEMLRPGLLDGRVVVVAGAPGEFGTAVASACEQLGATIVSLPDADEDVLAQAAGGVVAEHGTIDALICDGASMFHADAEEIDGVRACVDRSWDATRAVANAAFIPGERGGKVLLIAPRPDAGPHAGAARAALENTARTLSIEWARYKITTTAIGPGAGTAPADVATLAAFIASRAGDYYSGCIFSLGGA